MEDVRKIAEERAARGRDPSAARSFETEHQRAKKALVRQINALDKNNIQMIAASQEADGENRVLRTAAYCRVSTDDIDQAISIALQVNEYKKKIQANPNWKYVGTYVDDGFSGTNTHHREGFKKLMADAMDGKIDLIITKAVSRFARNLMDCIVWVEALQNHDPPVRVYFEQENLDTMAQTSNIILIVLAMVAQEESHMKSEAILLSLEWRFSRGRFLTPKLFGYDLAEVPDGYGGRKKVLEINEPEARVVRFLYYSLAGGASPEEAASVLTELEVPTGGRRKDGSYNTHWTGSGIRTLLRNEKYCGDVLARKTYTPNYKDHKARKNTGQKNKYYQPDHHEAIVSRSVWNAVQRILNSRKYGHEGTYLPMRVIDHGIFTGFISMNRSWSGPDAEDHYRASQAAMGLLPKDKMQMGADLGNEYLPEGGRKAGRLVDDHGITRIARELTKAEKEVQRELDGVDGKIDNSVPMNVFQVVDGTLFTRVDQPVLRIDPRGIHFSASCAARMDCTYAEFLFNPVERMAAVRPCRKEDPNAIPWGNRKIKNKNTKIGATALSSIIFASMGWDKDYSYRIPCHTLKQDGNTALLFDLDDYVGRAINRKDDLIMAKEKISNSTKTNNPNTNNPQSKKSYYYPPEEDSEPQVIVEEDEENTEMVRRAFGEPAFQHSDSGRFSALFGDSSSWDLMAEAKPIDITHEVERKEIDQILGQIREDPPRLPECEVFLENEGVDGVNGSERASEKEGGE